MNSINQKQSLKNVGFIDWITQYESFVIFGGFGLAIMCAIILTGIFQAGDSLRPNILYNALGALLMAGLFIYLIFKFMGEQINIMGKTLDLGMVVYIAIVLFVIFVFGN